MTYREFLRGVMIVVLGFAVMIGATHLINAASAMEGAKPPVVEAKPQAKMPVMLLYFCMADEKVGMKRFREAMAKDDASKAASVFTQFSMKCYEAKPGTVWATKVEGAPEDRLKLPGREFDMCFAPYHLIDENQLSRAVISWQRCDKPI